MTRIAVISDIHGNIDALCAVLADAEQNRVSRIFMCGDITGYYYDSAAVWQQLKRHDALMCRGNHERILADWMNGDAARKEAIRKRYGSSYQRAYEEMALKDLQELLTLPHPVAAEIDGVRFLISHGAPWGEDVYIYPDKLEDNLPRLAEYAAQYDVVFMGHTHCQMMFTQSGLQIVNPGSVGQPRSGKEDKAAVLSRAQWALYDTNDRSCRLMTSFYDHAHVYEQIDRYDPDLPYLKKVLSRQESSS